MTTAGFLCDVWEPELLRLFLSGEDLGENRFLPRYEPQGSSQSMTFTTNPGHLIYPGSITFSASPGSGGAVNFNINLGGTVANAAEFTFGGSGFEDAQWNQFLAQIKSFCTLGH